MYILTERELEFLVQLQANWQRYYLNEIALLMTENGENQIYQNGASIRPAVLRFVACSTHISRSTNSSTFVGSSRGPSSRTG